MGHDGTFDHHQPKRGGSAMKITTVGIDLAKDIFRVHGCDARGRVVVSKSLTRHELRVFVAKLPPCLVGMEACHTAHYWAHAAQKFGHQVKLMAPRFIRPYVKNNKNDTRDAEAICEAVTRPTMRFVPVKSRAQLDVQAVHRVRQHVVKERAALANQLRGFLAEHGIPVRNRFAAVRCALTVSDHVKFPPQTSFETPPSLSKEDMGQWKTHRIG